MGFWRAGPMHCFGAGLQSSTTGTAGSTNCGEKTAASALKAPGMTGVDSTGASVTTSCFGTLTTRTLPALFSRKVSRRGLFAHRREAAFDPVNQSLAHGDERPEAPNDHGPYAEVANLGVPDAACDICST